MKAAALAELELLRGSDVARMLGISRQAVHELHRRGRAPKPAVTLPYGALWAREDVDAWAEERRRARARRNGAADEG
ncbi:MAG: helix-turn-helix domain-containing protein [Candidatus Rokuibacteriota bacterium]